MRKLITCLVLFILYCLLAFPIAAIDDVLNTNSFYLVTSLGFGVLDSIISFIILKCKSIFNIITGFVIAFIALSAAHLLMELRWNPDWDDYGMMTAICTNAISSVILWEIALQIKKRYLFSHGH